MSLDMEYSVQRRGQTIWSIDEHNILVQMTNGYIKLDAKDSSISWTKHWMNVSLYLTEKGYNKTEDTCRLYWKHVIESQYGTNADAKRCNDGLPNRGTDRGTALSASDQPCNSCSNKRLLPYSSFSTDSYGNGGSSQPPKKQQVKDERCQATG